MHILRNVKLDRPSFTYSPPPVRILEETAYLRAQLPTSELAETGAHVRIVLRIATRHLSAGLNRANKKCLFATKVKGRVFIDLARSLEEFTAGLLVFFRGYKELFCFLTFFMILTLLCVFYFYGDLLGSHGREKNRFVNPCPVYKSARTNYEFEGTVYKSASMDLHIRIFFCYHVTPERLRTLPFYIVVFFFFKPTLTTQINGWN